MLCINVLKMVIFIRIVQFRSFAKAADSLGLSSSSISKHIRDLEQAIQARLIKRTTRSLSLTEAGERAYSCFTQFIHSLDILCEDILLLADHPYRKPRPHTALTVEDSHCS